MAEIIMGTCRAADDAPPLVVAEIGANHDGSPDKAADTVRAVASAGVKAVKFQLYTAAELVADADRVVTWGPPEHRVTEKVGAMFDRLSLPFEALRDLFALARELGMEPFATPFSERGADRLMELNVPAFKIAASDVTHLPMLKHVATLGKPIVLSLGKCTLAEADQAVQCVFDNGCRELALLHCVAAYPSPIAEMNLRVIPALIQTYPECIIGFSDHSMGSLAAVAAVALGARIIEKHVTLDKTSAGPDHWFSLDMAELNELVCDTADAFATLGHPRKRVLKCEQRGKLLGTRSLVAVRDLVPGTILSGEDLVALRPGTGLSPDLWDSVVGMEIRRAVPKGCVLTWDVFRQA